MNGQKADMMRFQVLTIFVKPVTRIGADVSVVHYSSLCLMRIYSTSYTVTEIGINCPKGLRTDAGAAA